MTTEKFYSVYTNAIGKFSRKFSIKIRELKKHTPADIQEDKKTAEKVYNDLDAFVKKNPQFELIDDHSCGKTQVTRNINFITKSSDYFSPKLKIAVKFNKKKKNVNEINSIGKTMHTQSPYYIGVNITNRLNIIYLILDFMIQCSDELSQLDEFYQKYLDKHQNEKTKNERIKKLTTNSIEEWVKKTMQNSGYQYKIETEKNKSLLVVKITGKQQLEIPLYDKSFQKIVPKILESIKLFEELITKSEIKILIGNVSSFDKNSWIKS